ncbi:uncharacterized protein LOC113508789 isoform X2 [Trichoplusia ni]|uniref:Uncharacterized protein LOC113508789 isoform X2 n=1 Tax=Trichoplusia ni TaxID=7111 RepID=A0A7E5X393_TRINI|nr:uncharacterized protein LOC113508789 isoform X2 [Trichoplusia ni]
MESNDNPEGNDNPPVPLGPKPKVLVGQLRILLEAIEKDSEMYNGRNSDMVSLVTMEKWHLLAQKLNRFPNGANISVSSWKYVLRYWSTNTKKKRIYEKKNVTRARNAALSDEEANELAQLEKRFYKIIKKEETRDILDMTDHGVLDPVSKPASGENVPERVNYTVEMFNVRWSLDNDENAAPRLRKRRGGAEEDETGSREKSKKLKIIFDSEARLPRRVIVKNVENVQKLNLVSRQLEEHITTIQSRIHMIKDLWKHRCGDN